MGYWFDKVKRIELEIVHIALFITFHNRLLRAKVHSFSFRAAFRYITRCVYHFTCVLRCFGCQSLAITRF